MVRDVVVCEEKVLLDDVIPLISVEKQSAFKARSEILFSVLTLFPVSM